MMNYHDDEIIEEILREAEAAEAQLAAIRQALGGYPDSDLASLATTVMARLAAVEREIEDAHRYLDESYVNDRDECEAVPLVERIARLVSMLAANATTPVNTETGS